MHSKLAIIAGGGEAPERIASLCRTQARSHIVIALEGHANPEAYPGSPLVVIRIGAAGHILETLKAHNIRDIVFIGAVERPGLLQLRPDTTALKILGKIGYSGLGDDGLLRAIITYLETEFGYHIVAADALLAQEETSGDITSFQTIKTPSEGDLHDIARGQTILRALAPVDVGQSVIIQEGLVLGVEAVEGTDALIQRCARLKRESDQAGVLVKLAKTQQDKRVDLPTIGVETIHILAKAQFGGLAFNPKETLILDPQKIWEMCNEYSLFMHFLSSGEEA